jgi:cytochrome c oxidase subunit 4
MTHQPATEPLDQTDPHHELGHHGHVIVRPRTLVAVLAALLAFTVMTVFASRAEIWAAETFHVKIPNMVNVGIVLSIAAVKSLLVALFFMQLKYDNPLNAIVFLFCLFAFSLFLFFSMTDLSSRGVVYSYKAGEIQVGGLGINSAVRDQSGGLVRGVDTQNKPIAVWARERRIEKIGELAAMQKIDLAGKTPDERYWEEWEVFNHRPAHPSARPAHSDASHSAPKSGLTPGLFEPATGGTEPTGSHGH